MKRFIIATIMLLPFSCIHASPAAADLIPTWWGDTSDPTLRTAYGPDSWSPLETFDNSANPAEGYFWVNKSLDLDGANAPYGYYENPLAVLIEEHFNPAGGTPPLLTPELHELELRCWDEPSNPFEPWEFVGFESIGDGWWRNVWEIEEEYAGGIWWAKAWSMYVVEAHQAIQMRWNVQMINVPEPSALALLSLGAIALLRRKSRKWKRRSH